MRMIGILMTSVREDCLDGKDSITSAPIPCYAAMLLCCYAAMLLCCYAAMLLCCYAAMLW